VTFIALQKSNDLYFVDGLLPGSSGPRVSRLANNPQLLSELWHKRIGHPGLTQLSLLDKHITGLPSQLTLSLHPMHSCHACNDGKIGNTPMGHVSNTAPFLPGTRFHLNFGCVRAFSADFGVSAGNCVVTLYSGNNAYLIIVCAKAHQTWIFCQASKLPPIFIIEYFLALNVLKSGPQFLRMDQGGELWRSNQLREVAAAAVYSFEPTGSDAASKNGKVERPNGTFGAMVRCLLYSVGLSAKLWYAALVRAVYFNNRLYHNAFYMTPYEAWTGVKPALAHIHTFGSLVTARKPGKRPVKADRHTDHGVLLGYGATTKHIRYFDQTMNREKLSTHHTIDAHYSKTRHPPGPQIIMDMGYEQEPVLLVVTMPPPLSWYLLRSRHKSVTPGICKILPLLMNEFMSAPFAIVTSITASDSDHNNSVTVTFITDPFGSSFRETIFLSCIHPTLGLDLHYDVDHRRCQLIKMDHGTPLHRMSQWKSCFIFACIISIDTMSV
jgi:hypothetical protein